MGHDATILIGGLKGDAASESGPGQCSKSSPETGSGLSANVPIAPPHGGHFDEAQPKVFPNADEVPIGDMGIAKFKSMVHELIREELNAVAVSIIETLVQVADEVSNEQAPPEPRPKSRWQQRIEEIQEQQRAAAKKRT